MNENVDRDSVASHCSTATDIPLRRFNAKEFVVVFCEKHSERVAFTVGFVTAELANKYADGIKEDGGIVFRVLPTGMLVAAMSRVLPQVWERRDNEYDGDAGYE